MRTEDKKPIWRSRTVISLVLGLLIQVASIAGWIPEGWDPVLIESVKDSVTGTIETATSLSDALSGLLVVMGIIFRSKATKTIAVVKKK